MMSIKNDCRNIGLILLRKFQLKYLVKETNHR